MSEIPASQRPETKLETLDLAYDLRARITFELEQSFGYSQKILESRVKKLQRQHPDPNLEAAKIVKMEEDFGCWFIEHERERMLTLCQDISTNLRKANTIFPYLTHGQITDLSRLYYKLFRRIPEWKKRHSKLHWLMVHPSPVSG